VFVIRAGQPYDLAADPQETNNLYETSPETVEKLRQVLQMAKIEGVALK